jgi:4-hydroxy-tetrahydrodipicolinate synthase
VVVRQSFRGVLPAMQVPFTDDFHIDVEALQSFGRRLASHDGVTALVTNGHTGEIFSLSPEERADVTRAVVDAVDVPVVSGVSAEGIDEAIRHALLVKEAGATGLLVMPPHHWLRFGMSPEHVLDYFRAVGEATDLNLVVHVYPAWTRASYSSELLGELAGIPQVTTFKVGTRDMSQYDRDVHAIRAAGGDRVTILTCHDEYLLPSMVQGVDGALVGFASFIPELIVALWNAVQRGDLKTAQALHQRIYPLKEVVYGSGEPSSEAHARMKTAMKLAGRFPSDVVRPPIQTPTGATFDRIAAAVQGANLSEPATAGV